MSSPPIFDAIRRVQERYQNMLMQKQNVVGVALGYRAEEGQLSTQPAVVVLVEEKKPLSELSDSDVVPRDLEGIRTDVYAVGKLMALGDFEAQHAASPRERHRPTIPAGVSIGHFRVTAGTVGAVVRDRTTGQRLILSNNHVLANSNEAVRGDAILQPASLDGGQNPGDRVAELERFLALTYLEGDVQPPPQPKPPTPPPARPPTDGCSSLFDVVRAIGRLFGGQQSAPPSNTAQAAPPEAVIYAQTAQKDNIGDAALARPLNDEMFISQVRGIGPIRRAVMPTLGMKIRKTGRTTDTTQSTVTLLNATVSVAYNTSQGMRNARFNGQVICDAFSQGGDSGALVVEAAAQNAVGLLFAGSGLASIFTPIDVILDALNVDLELT